MERPDAGGHRGAEGIRNSVGDDCRYRDFSLPRQARITRRRFVGRALMFTYSGDYAALRVLFAAVPEPTRYELAGSLTERLAEHGKRTGAWAPWAEVQWHIPHPGREAAAAELVKRIGAWATPPRPETTDGRRQLARLAVRLVRNGASNRDLLTRLARANATFVRPLPIAAIASVATWACKVGAEQHARG
jgi:hypothetical protein